MKTLQFFRDISKRHHWRVLARNGCIQGSGRSNGYRDIGECIAAAESVLRIEIADGKALGYGYSIHAKREIGFHEVMKLKCDV